MLATRRLAAILAADIAGFSRLTGLDEAGTVQAHDLAIEHVETSLRLSLRERMGSPLSLMGLAYLFRRQFEQATTKLLLAIQDHPGFPPSYRHLAVSYAHMGRPDEAHAAIAKLRAITPVVVPGNMPFRDPEDRELYLSGLRLAAGETA